MTGLVDGAAFALDAPSHIPPIWGSHQEVLWSQGEPLMICGPQGVGKSTLAQRLILARLGIGDLNVLGRVVTPDPGRAVLLIAADRPNQIARSLRRMVTEHDRRALADLVVWRGPLPFDITTDTDRLLAMAQEVNAGTVVIDSLKDVALPLTEDRVGASVNIAIQKVIAAGIELVDTHHQRKATGENKKPNALADVYGSTWLTSGHGSVVLLWGEPGDPIVELIHLKQPGDTVGPLELVHDHLTGAIRAHERATITQILTDAGRGITVADAAIRMWGPGATRSQTEKTRRKLDGAVKAGHATRIDGAGQKDPAIYTVIDRDSQRDSPRTDHARSRTPANADHEPITPHHDPPVKGSDPLKGARAADRDSDREATPDEEDRYRRALALVEDVA